jgi:hypothetical protein
MTGLSRGRTVEVVESTNSIHIRIRSPRKVTQIEVIIRSGSPRRARKDEVKKPEPKKSGSPRRARKQNIYSDFLRKYWRMKGNVLGTSNGKSIMKALADDWRAGIRSY